MPASTAAATRRETADLSSFRSVVFEQVRHSLYGFPYLGLDRGIHPLRNQLSYQFTDGCIVGNLGGYASVSIFPPARLVQQRMRPDQG